MNFSMQPFFLVEGLVFGGGKGDITGIARTVSILVINLKALYIPPMTFRTPSHSQRGAFSP